MNKNDDGFNHPPGSNDAFARRGSTNSSYCSTPGLCAIEQADIDMYCSVTFGRDGARQLWRTKGPDDNTIEIREASAKNMLSTYGK